LQTIKAVNWILQKNKQVILYSPLQMEPKLRIFYLYFKKKFYPFPGSKTGLILFHFAFVSKMDLDRIIGDTALNNLFWTAYTESRLIDAME